MKKIISSRGLKAIIEVDGGIDKDNAVMLVDAGADVLVSGTAIFGSKDIPKQYMTLEIIQPETGIDDEKVHRTPS